MLDRYRQPVGGNALMQVEKAAAACGQGMAHFHGGNRFQQFGPQAAGRFRMIQMKEAAGPAALVATGRFGELNGRDAPQKNTGWRRDLAVKSQVAGIVKIDGRLPWRPGQLIGQSTVQEKG